jgi:multiple sugar transport system permease protein
LVGYIFISPWIIGFLAFGLFPFVASFAISFCRWDIVTAKEFVGLGNYRDIFVHDRLFWKSLATTAYYSVLHVPLSIVGGIAIALLLNRPYRFIRVFRTVYYLPAVTSGVAVALLWSWLFHADFGLINTVLRKCGLVGPAWLESQEWAIPALVIMSLWGVGGSMVIYLAGLQAIPKQLYEVADIDGASWFRKQVSITLPMLSPTIFFTLILGVIGSFQVFTQAYVMTRGGPANATLFYVLNLYFDAFEYFRMGYACALAWILFVIVLVLTLVQFKLAKRWVYYEGDLKA